MKADFHSLTIKEIINLRSAQMMYPNPEYQRGTVWTLPQKKKLVDSLLRNYPLPLIYLHKISQQAGGLVSQRFEIIDGQQRITALADYADDAFKLFDPLTDEAEARFPDFIKKQPCPWARKTFSQLDEDLRTRFLGTSLQIVQIETDTPTEARDLFVRLQAGMPLNSQEKRDAWPGQFTDFILKLGGKPGIARYPGHDFFVKLMKAGRTQDRGKFRQLAAQMAVLYFSRRAGGSVTLPDINAGALDDFYYENLGFDANSADARRLVDLLDKLVALFGDEKRSKIIGHEAMHLLLLVDSLWDDYTRSWETGIAEAFDRFRHDLGLAKQTQNDEKPAEHWLRYGVHTRVNSDRGESIQRRQEFFASKMYEILKPQLKDPKRLYGLLEREIIYFREKKQCAVCDAVVPWPELEIHHVTRHSNGGTTDLANGAPVHRHCHPKSQRAEEDLARRWSGRAT